MAEEEHLQRISSEVVNADTLDMTEEDTHDICSEIMNADTVGMDSIDLYAESFIEEAAGLVGAQSEDQIGTEFEADLEAQREANGKLANENFAPIHGKTTECHALETRESAGTKHEQQDLVTDPLTPQEVDPQEVHAQEETKGTIEDVSENGFEEVLSDGPENEGKSVNGEKVVASFPFTRVKRIIKLDQDIKLVSRDGIALITEAAALFVESLTSASLTVMLQQKRKSIRGPDVVIAARSTRQFRECLGNDLATLLEESNGRDQINALNGATNKEDGTGEESTRKRPQREKVAKKHHPAPPLGSRSITTFFKT